VFLFTTALPQLQSPRKVSLFPLTRNETEAHLVFLNRLIFRPFFHLNSTLLSIINVLPSLRVLSCFDPEKFPIHFLMVKEECCPSFPFFLVVVLIALTDISPNFIFQLLLSRRRFFSLKMIAWEARELIALMTHASTTDFVGNRNMKTEQGDL
jgi:hypothetical protein